MLAQIGRGYYGAAYDAGQLFWFVILISFFLQIIVPMLN